LGKQTSRVPKQTRRHHRVPKSPKAIYLTEEDEEENSAQGEVVIIGEKHQADHVIHHITVSRAGKTIQTLLRNRHTGEDELYCEDFIPDEQTDVRQAAKEMHDTFKGFKRPVQVETALSPGKLDDTRRSTTITAARVNNHRDKILSKLRPKKTEKHTRVENLKSKEKTPNTNLARKLDDQF
jgi:hypothetical protein